MEPVRCPLCDAPLRAKRGDPWEVVRSLAAVHLRQCANGPKGDREVATLAIRIADEAQNAEP